MTETGIRASTHYNKDHGSLGRLRLPLETGRFPVIVSERKSMTTLVDKEMERVVVSVNMVTLGLHVEVQSDILTLIVLAIGLTCLSRARRDLQVLFGDIASGWWAGNACT